MGKTFTLLGRFFSRLNSGLGSQLPGQGARLAAELGVVGALVAVFAADDELAPRKLGDVHASLGDLALLDLDLDV